MTLLVYFVFVALAKSQGEKLTARGVIFKNAIFSQGSGGLPMGILDFTQETTHLTNNIVRLWHHSGNKRNTKLAVVTAFDNRYMSEGVRQLKYFVGLKQMSNIQKSLIVYNLGINKTNFEIIQQKFSTKMRMRKMNFGRYPSLIRKVMTYGWKPLIVDECLEEFDVVWYLDAAVLAKGNFANDLKINGTLTKLTPGHHGIHIHVFGDISDGCGVAGHHFNPEQKNHGGPNDFERHVGDLGNILADQNGISNLDIFDNKIALIGSNSIVGRSVVIHSKRDDLGRGGDMESLKTGNSGGRIGCGIIGVTSENYKPKNAGLKLIKNANFAFMLLFFYAILN